MGLPRDPNQSAIEYINGRNITEKPNGSGGPAFLLIAIFIIVSLVPYAIISLIPALIIFLVLKNKFCLKFTETYLGTFFSTLTFNLGVTITFILCLKLFIDPEAKETPALIPPLIFMILGITGTVLLMALILHKIIRIKFTLALRYSIFLVIPTTILYYTLSSLLSVYLYFKQNHIEPPSLNEITEILKQVYSSF
ncbi:hypothetical protein DMZ48_02995 [Robertkochia solimangrovi]|nr:hypothetical protein DMZ48_02995 [Robertkochia solimangrovi]